MIASHAQMQKDNDSNVHKLEVMDAPLFPHSLWAVLCAAVTIHHTANWKQMSVANEHLKNADKTEDWDLRPLEVFMKKKNHKKHTSWIPGSQDILRINSNL